MKKTILVLLVLSAVLFSAVAGDFHYGIESSASYKFNVFSDPSASPNVAKFAFSPYVKGDFFTVRLLAEWKPNEDGAHGFDYLLDFNMENPYELTESVLKYIDYVKVNTGIFDLYVGRGDLGTVYESNLAYAATATHYKAEAKINAGIARIYAGTSDFENNGATAIYNSTQHANVVFDLGFLEIEADAVRQAALHHSGTMGTDFNRIIPKVGATLKPGPVTVGVFYSTDFSFDEGGEMNIKPLERWVLEAEVGLKLGFFDLEGTFFLNNMMTGYRSLKSEDGKAMFGFALNAKADIADFVRVNIDALVPLKLNDKLAIERDPLTHKTLESVKASVDIGTWWRVGASVDIHGLVSSIEDHESFLTIIQGAKPVIHAGIYTETFDLSVKGEIMSLESYATAVTVSAAFRVDNFFSSVTK